MKASVTLYSAQQGHQAYTALWHDLKAWLIAGHRLSLSIKPETRSTEQNSLFWSCLTDISRQVEWPVDGRMVRMEPEDWKHVLSAGLKRHQRVAAGIDGGFVVMGQSTSKLTRAEMSELVTLTHAFGDERGVKWSRTSLGREVPDACFAEAICSK